MNAPKPNAARAVLAWHFLHPDNKLRDGRDAPPDGEWLRHDGPIILCKRGLHASERVIDALRHHPSRKRSPICRVELGGIIVADDDKDAASERRILWRLDGDTTDAVLRDFARWCALQVIGLWDAPEIVRQWLETGDESLRDAARDAAWAAWAAARSAAQSAAWAAWAAARSAAWDAGWDAAQSAAWAAGAAAGDAAWDAGWDAARDEQNAHLEQLINAAHERQGTNDA